MYIPISDDKHRKFRDRSKSALEIRDKFSQRQNAVQDKIQSRTEFVSDYISQLYFYAII